MSGFVSTLTTSKTKIARSGGVQITSSKVKKITDTFDRSATEIKKLIPTTQKSFDLNDTVIDNFFETVKDLTDQNKPQKPYPTENIFNVIKPSYLIAPKSGTKQKSIDRISTPTRNLEPYEKLTGISHDRPEILMVSSYIPLFEGTDKKKFTDAGMVVDSQIQVRNLRSVNLINMFKDLQKNDREFKNTFEKRNSEFKKSIKNLNFYSSFLLQLVKNINATKNALDLRDSIYTVDTSTIIKEHNLNFTKTEFSENFNSLQRSGQKYLPKTYTIVDLFENLGYNKENVITKFSSTKLWLQFLLDYKSIIKNHSLDFFEVKKSTSRATDNNSISILKNDNDPVFFIKDADPPGLLPIVSLASLQEGDIRSIVANIKQSYGFIYQQNAIFNSHELKIAALGNFLSKEYSYSRGLSEPEVVDLLSRKYSYDVQDNNLRVFDNVIGKFPSTILDIPNVKLTSLASIAQQNVSENVGVLPFESKYIESSNSTITPGSVWFIDDVVQNAEKSFDTIKLDSFIKSLKTSYSDFSTFTNKMNLYSVGGFNSTDQKFNNSLAARLPDVSSLCDYVISHFLDPNGDTFQYIINDKLASVYAHAVSSPDLKSLLFLLTMNRITRSYNFTTGLTETPRDNTAFTSDIVKRITKLLSSTVKPTVGNSRDKVDFLPVITLAHSIKTGTALSTIIERFMFSMFNEFRKSGAINAENNRSLYGGHLDTVIMMVAFDMFISAIYKYSNQRLVGKAITLKKSTNYLISTQNINFKDNFNNLINKLEKEVAVIQQMTWMTLTVIKRLSDTLTNFSNKFKDKSALESFSKIKNLTNSNDEFTHLLSEQQIMLLASSIQDVSDKVLNDSNEIFEPGLDSQLKILDDIKIPVSVKNSFYQTFKQAEFVDKSSFNKKIFTVGLPLGFANRFKQESKISGKQLNFIEKQADIISIDIYKIDVLNEDIVFKPQSFLFELSRFPVRNYTNYRKVSDGSDMSDIISSIPTRDFEQYSEGDSSLISYLNNKIDKSLQSMNTESYSFLSENRKRSIIQNHVFGFFLELYLKFLTGISTAEQTFDLDQGELEKVIDSEFTNLIIKKNIQSVLKKNSSKNSTTTTNGFLNNLVQSSGNKFKTTTNQKSSGGGVFFTSPLTNSQSFSVADKQTSVQLNDEFDNFAKKLDNKTDNLSNLLSGLESDLKSRENVKILLKTVKSATSIKSTINNPDIFAKHLFRPKQFDRVFNIILDPDDFEINYELTTSSVFGKKNLEYLVKKGEVIVTVNKKTGQRSFKTRQKDITRGSVTFDRYFMTVSSLDEKK